MDNVKSGNISWSWADQLSSYRFWGLAGYFVLICGLGNFQYFSLIYRLMDHWGLPMSVITTANEIKSIAGIFGFLLAWAAVRSKSHHILYLYGLLALTGTALISYSGNLVFLFAGVFLFGLMVGAVAIAVPAFIAGAGGRSETYVVTFGVMMTINYISGSFGAQATMDIVSASPDLWVLFAVMAVPIIVGMLLIIPLNPALFDAPPPSRGITLPVKRREPVAVFFLCLLVPFYFLYWVYRTHGEVRALGDSSSLLSAKASAWLCVFVPFLFPVMMVTVNDHINAAEAASRKEAGSKKPRPTWIIVTWCVLFGPAAAALIQSDLNKTMPADAGLA